MDKQTVIRQTDRQSPPGALVDEWALRRTPGPRRRGHGGPAQGNREYVGGPQAGTGTVHDSAAQKLDWKELEAA